MSDRIIVAGDWHANTDWAVAVVEAAGRAGINKILHVGDFGFGMNAFGRLDPDGRGYGYEEVVDQAAADAAVAVYFVPGNHDNHDEIDHVLASRGRDEDGFGRVAGHIRVAPRAHTWQWGGRRFASLMGAYSIDQHRRTPGLDWWRQEEPTMADLDALLAMAAGLEVDVLIGHDVPQGTAVRSPFSLPRHMANASRHTRELLAIAVSELRPQLVFAGHWHQRLTHQLDRRTRVEVLDKEHTAGNAVVLDLGSLEIVPLDVAQLSGGPIAPRR